MLRYLVAPPWVDGPKTFSPSSEVVVEVGGRLFRLFFSGAECSGELYFEGVVGGRCVFQALGPGAGGLADSVKSPASFLSGFEGFYGGFAAGDGLWVFRDHAGLVPVFVCGDGLLVTNVLAEAVAWGSANPVEPGTLRDLITSTTYNLWRPADVKPSVQSLRHLLVYGVGRFLPERPAVFFSGGLDSFIVAWACIEAGLKPLLLTLGVEGGHDLAASAKAAEALGIDVHRVVIDVEDVREALISVEELLGRLSVMDMSIASAMYLLAREASGLGHRVAVVGQGADELFAGYKKYENLYLQNDLNTLTKTLQKDLETLKLLGLARDFTAARAGGVFLVPPFMFREVMEQALSTPLEDKIGVVDGRVVRKMVLRDLVREAGFDVVAGVGKKALQYGSGVEKIVRRLMR
jgi:asparagine synthase (glutamine-hydrolysing)